MGSIRSIRFFGVLIVAANILWWVLLFDAGELGASRAVFSSGEVPIIGQFSVVESTRLKPAIRSSVESGTNLLQSSQVRVIGNKNHKPVAGNMTIFFDLSSRSFAWTFDPEYIRHVSGKDIATQAFRASPIAYSASDGVFLFDYAITKIRVTPPAGRASNLRDAERQALKRLQADAAKTLSEHGLWPAGVDIPFWRSAVVQRVIPFLSLAPFAEIRSVERRGKQWCFVLETEQYMLSLTADRTWNIRDAKVTSNAQRRYFGNALSN